MTIMQKRVYQTRKQKEPTNHRTYLQSVYHDFHLPQNQKIKRSKTNKQLLRASGYHTKIDSTDPVEWAFSNVF